MNQLFNHNEVLGADKFTGDISGWDMSKVENMYSMFFSASSFNSDISRWDVSRVKNMNTMFYAAKSFNQTLCAGAWLTSTADKYGMFKDSPGQICDKKDSSRSTSACKKNITSNLS